MVSDIPDQSIAEGASFVTINLDDYVADVDDLDADIAWTYSGNTQLTVSIDAARVATITAPHVDWSGTETITFRGTDPGTLFDEDPATFTITSVNDAPVVSDIPDQTVDEGGTFATVNLSDYVNDVDHPDTEMTWTYSGNTELTVSIDGANVATITIPDVNWNGAETITFRATDPGALFDENAATFTVSAINDAPVVTDIPGQTVSEGAAFTTISLDDYVSDLDNADADMTWTYSGNTELTVTIDAGRVATIGLPDADWNGSETITFRATDPGTLFDEDAATFTVTAVNDAPVVTDIPDQAIPEGSTVFTVELDDYVSDVDNIDADMTWTYSGNVELTVSIDGSRIATVTAPSVDWNGSENITFRATDPGSLFDEDAATFTVSADNDAPVVTGIPDQTVAEGATFTTIALDDYVSDVDNTDAEMTWTYTDNSELTVSIDGSRVATITIPSADWYGAETITFRATDPGLLFGEDAATFTVTNINDAPVVSDIPDQTLAEGASFATVNLDNYVADIDNPDADISWTYSGNTDLTVTIDAGRVATVTAPGPDWNGAETITFRATDPGTLFDENAATFTLTAVNDAPVVSGIPDQTIDEGQTFATILLDNYVTDVDNADAEMIWTKTGNTQLLVDITDRVATVIIPSADWNGSETITFRATDPGTQFGEDAASFTVTAVNDAPVVSDIPNQTVAEGGSFTTVNLDDYVSDIDNVDADMSWSYSGNVELTVDIDVNHIATITIPDVDWNGSEAITFTATDPGLASGGDPATFTVTGVNDAPVVIDIPDQTIDEGQTFATISLDDFVSDVDDADADITWTYSGNTELTVSIDAGRVATISTPTADWSGSETITFRAADPGTLFDEDAATFTVNAVNDAPVVAGIPDQTIGEGGTFASIDLDDYVTDVDNVDADLTWSYSGDVELTVDIDVNRVATITIPDVNWNGSETITFTATDPGLLSGSDFATLTVTAVNDAPIVTDIPDQTIAEGASFTTINLDDYVSDLDNADNEIAWSYTGNTELSVTIDVSRIATITAPSSNWSGDETITFRATDPGTLFDEDAASFTVTAVNDAPVVADIPDQTVSEGSNFTQIDLDDYVSDVDNLDADMTWTYGGNVELSVSIDAARVATITTPGSDWNGSETITFRATDPGALFDEDAATFTVSGANDAPIVTDIPDQTIAEGSTFTTINLDDYVSDIDNTDAELTWTYTGNSELTVSIDVNRIATITIPNVDWYGSELITFRATDPGSLFDEDAATFTVTNVNDAPVVAGIPDQTLNEGQFFATITLDNYVIDIDDADADLVWAYSGNTDLTVIIDAGRIAYISAPDADWNGSETITFTATDPGALFSEDAATFTLTAVNDGPIVTDIPDQTIAEGSSFASINLDDYVSDIDNTDAEIIWTKTGNTELLVDITNNVATIVIPSSNWNGSETITFRATDPGTLFDEDAATFTVSAVNDAPVVSGIPNQTVTEGDTFASISLDAYVSDLDNVDADMTWTYSGNVELTVSIDVNRVATIGIPSADWNGSETITFTATDPGLASDSDPVTFTVTAVNDAPVVSNIPDQTIAEGSSFATITLDDYVSDVDNLDNEISWSYAGNTELTVVIDINRIATITVPSPTWNGAETITFTATDPGLLTSADAAVFTVSAVNNAPVVSDIPNQTISEGGSFTSISLDDYVTDVDNTDEEITWTYSGNSELTVSIDASRIATITIPDVNWNGSELITFTATDPSLLSNSNPATFTVTAINDAPVVSDIPNQTIAEGASFTSINLDNYVTDVDNLASEMSWAYSGNVELSVSIVNRVAIITTPNGDWTGFESITFTATDPGSLSAFDPAVFTVTAINDAPVVSDIPNQTIAEGSTFATINLDSYVSDVDNLASEMSWSWVGNSQLTVSLDVNRVATITIPDVNWNGAETITFRATDPGLLTASDLATFTVTAVNDAPVVADIPDQMIDEGQSFATINLDTYVSDVDDADADIAWTYSGNSELTVTIDAGRVATIGIPSSSWNGSETITFTATDPGLLFAEDAATFTVSAVNDAPVVSDIPNQTVSEGDIFTTISLDDYVSDIDNLDSEMSWSYSGNTELTVDIDVNRIATITIPNLDWNGSEVITFTATDPGLQFDSDPATFTVTAINDAPVVSDIPNQTIAEGASFTSITLDNYVSDVDNLDNEISWTYAGNSELMVVIDVNRVATITAPSPTWNGAETITFTATDPGLLNASDLAVFTVTAVNNAPVVSDIPDQTIAEGGTFTTINLDDYVSDIDDPDDALTWTYSGNSELTVSIDVDRIATITIPDINWNGSEVITFTASDPSLLSNSDAATFTATPINDAPVVSDIPDQTVAEGVSFTSINLDNYVTDVDNLASEMTWSYLGNNELTVSIVNRVAIISMPSPDWNGSEVITFTAADPGMLNASDPARFTVTAVNDAPVVSDIPNQTIAEGETFAAIALDSYVSDVDNLDSEISWSWVGQSQLTVSIDVNRVATVTIPSSDWNGSETITFVATDPGSLTDSDPAVFTVSGTNDGPVVSDIPDQTVAEGASFATVNLDNYVTDIDNTDSEISWTYSGNTELIVDITNRVATITAPDIDWHGAETIMFTAADPGLLTDSDAAVFTITPVNDVPIVSSIPDQTVLEGTNLNFGVTATDPDLTIPALSAINVPVRATFVDNGDGTGTFDFNPDFTQTGPYTVTFIADDGLLADSLDVLITVNDAGNQTPELAFIADQSVAEGGNLIFGISATDADSTIPALSAVNTPTNTTFTDNGDGTGSFDFSPDFTQGGSYTVTFIASDGALADSQDVVITVTEAGNQAPELTFISDQTVLEGANLNFGISAADPDSTILALTAVNVPIRATFVDNGDGTGTFDFNPDYIQAGPYTVTFIASDGALADSQDVVITVTEAGNQTPGLIPVADQSVPEGGNLSLVVTAADPDSTTPALTALNVPIRATFVDNGDGTGTFDFNPDYTQAGIYTVTFVASDGALADSLDLTITVTEAGNQSPVLDPIADQSVPEGGTLNFGISAADPDSTIPALSALSVPTNATFVDNGDGTGTFDFNPDFTQAGPYTVTFVADDGALADSQDVVITVTDAGNQEPVLASIGPRSVAENINLNFTVSAVDPDSTIPALSTSTLPGGAGFTDNGDGTGVFDWTPTFDQAGIYDVTFYADDGAASDSEIVTITVDDVNRAPFADAGFDQVSIPAGALVTLDGTASDDPDGDLITYSWLQVSGTAVTLSSQTDAMPTFTPTVPDDYLFELTVADTGLASVPDTVLINVVNGAPPQAVADLGIRVNGQALDLSWSAVTADTSGFPADIDHYVVYRGLSAYFTPTATDSIGVTDALTLTFTDSDLDGADVVGDTLNQYFYVVQAVDIYGNRSALSNRVGECDYYIFTTATTNFSLIGIPFANTGITTADELIDAIGRSAVQTVNNYIVASQSYESRFAAGFGRNFTVSVGRVYQVNAATDTVFTVAGSVPDSGAVSYSLATTATTDFNFIMIPFEHESSYSTAQDVINAIPGVLNTLNNFIASSQSYVSRFAAGFGTNFTVRAGKPYQANVATTGTFPTP